MKSFKTILLLVGVIILSFTVKQVKAQFMPVVYDNIYGTGNRFITAAANFQDGDVVLVSSRGESMMLVWINRHGESLFTKYFETDEFRSIGKLIPLDEEKIMIMGSCGSDEKNKKQQGGRAMIMNKKGTVLLNFHFGEHGTVITHGQLLLNGDMIFSGTTPDGKGGYAGFVCKVNPANKILYNYTAKVGETCNSFDVQGNHSEYLNAVFMSENKSGCSVIRLDAHGKPYFITPLPDPTFKVEKMVSTIDGDIFLAGEGEQAGGALIKIRSEGDVVFQKQIVPVSEATVLDKLIVCPTKEVLVGGNDTKNAYYSLLRSDGTELSASVDKGNVAAITNNPVTGDCIISLYDANHKLGKLVKLSVQGRRLFEKVTAANYNRLRLENSGDLLMAAPDNGRLTMMSGFGELLFDRFVIENTPSHFSDVYLSMNGEVIFTGADNRVVKLAHGVYISDIVVNKPINGYATAVFTVSLSGFASSREGAPLPVTVDYNTKPISASEGVNFDPVSGTLSFVPSGNGSDRYFNKFMIEVPVKANEFLEGERTFSLLLSGVNNSYLIRSEGVASIQDQPAIVKMIGTTPGLEGETDVTYTLGIFKTNGVPLTNTTQTDIVIDGIFGNGTADRYDFDMGKQPRLVIAPGQHSGTYQVETVEDTRYESVKTVVVNFNKVYAMSDANISFGGNMLSCTGELYDQAALMAIESLGNHTKMNNMVSGLYRISLLRAKDGALQTNNSGSDIFLTTMVDESSTAKEGMNFVFTNAHDLRIWADDRCSAINLNGMVLYTTDEAIKTVSVSLTNVKAGSNAGAISIAPNKNTAQFMINNK